MKIKTDCLLIGHNEMDFVEYEKSIKKLGIKSGAYRDLNLNFIRYNNRSYSISEIYNLFKIKDEFIGSRNKILSMGSTFSATIAYLGTFLNSRELSFDYVNTFQENKKELADKLQNQDILTIAITTTYYVSVLPILEIIDFIKKYNSTAKIIIGGPFIRNQFLSQDPEALEYLLNTLILADYYVNSTQGEATLVKIIKSHKLHKSQDNIPNIYYKTPKGYVSSPLQEENNPLEDNIVDWNLFSSSLGSHANIRTAISCPFNCAFCGFPEHAGPYRVTSVGLIEKELSELNALSKVKSISFVDDTFNVPIKRFKEILRMMIKNRYTFKWHSHIRCQYLDEESVQLMKESGCEGVFLGLESGNNQMLENMNKKVKIEDYFCGIKLLKEAEIITFGSFIIGFPGETMQTFSDTCQFIKESGIDFFRAQLWYNDLLTPIWKQREKYKIQGMGFEWSHDTMDSQGALNLIEKIFCEIKTPIWVPQYNFDFEHFWHLIHKGMDMEEVKKFLIAFNNGVQEKVNNPLINNIGQPILQEILSCFTKEKNDPDKDEVNISNKKYKIDFSL